MGEPTPLRIAIYTYKLAPGRTNVNARWPADYVVIDSGNEAALWRLDHKAKVNAKNGDGQTPLHMAVTRGNFNAAKALIDHKADVNATDNSGNTPLALLEDLKMKEEKTWGSHGVFIDFKPVESLLLKHGAKGSFVSPKTNSPQAGF